MLAVYGYFLVAVAIAAAILLSVTLIVLLIFLRWQHQRAQIAGCTPLVVLKVFFFLTLCLLTLVLLVAVALDYLHVAAGVILAFLLWGSTYFLYPCVKTPAPTPVPESPASFTVQTWASSIGYNAVWTARHRPAVVIVGLVLIAGCCVALFVPLAGMCLDMYSGTITTRVTRSFDTPGCPAGPPCHVYVTVADQPPSVALIVNFHTKDVAQAVVRYDTVSHAAATTLSAYALQASGQSIYVDGIDEPRWVHWVDLTGLSPNTTYYFRVAETLTAGEFSVRTAPAGDALTFVAGGDMDINAQAVLTSQQAALVDPAFAVIGGDLAYANGWLPCYRKWDSFLTQWATYMRTADGRLIPLLTAIGNHETQSFFGADPLTQVPFYTRYLPHQLGLTTANPLLRPTYRAHRLCNNTVLLVLDSNHVATPAAQAPWITQQLAAAANLTFRLATYHVPMFPSYRPFNNADSVLLRQYFLPAFDQGNLTLALENHDHAYKRTKVLRGTTAVAAGQRGTTYIGDGCWGRTPRAASTDAFMEVVRERRHFLRVDVNATAIVVTAIDNAGAVFDSVTILP